MPSHSRSMRRGAEKETPTPQPLDQVEAGPELGADDLLDGVEGGQRSPVPYADELSGFFGADLSQLTAIMGVGDALGELGADAAQQEGTLFFADPNPTREQVAEEVGHALQPPSASTSTTTSPTEGAEREAKGAAAAFGAGEAGPATMEQRPSGIARDEGDDKTPLEQLREAAEGNWVGNVDEGLCLRLIGQLSAGERATAREDRALMRNLAGAFNATEIVQCVNTLNFALVWKAYWIKIAGEEGNVGQEVWQGLILNASVSQRVDLVTWSSYGMVEAAIGLSLPEMFSDAVADGSWGGLLIGHPALARKLATSLTPRALLLEVGSELIDEGEIPGILGAMGVPGAVAFVLLPTGSALTQDERRALRRVAGQLDVGPARAMFSKRFNAGTEGRWEDSGGDSTTEGAAGATEITWTHADLMAVWDVLDVLPDQDVSDNTVIRAWQTISGNRGFYSGPMANEERSGTIKLGQGLRTDSDPERLPHTVMHEVGHAVHRRINGAVNPWLEKGVGFWFYAEGDAGWRSLIADLGGWPTTYEDFSAAEQTFGEAQKARILELLAAHGGNQRWTQAAAMPDTSIVAPTEGAMGPASPEQEDALLWRAMPEALRDCLRLSTPKWYKNYKSLPSGPKGRYCFNHWYHQPFYFSSAAEAAIDATGDNYSAMSHKEFFANCYAEFFHDPAGYSDHSKWGGSLNPSVESFMRTHVLERQPYTPPGEGSDTDTTTNPAESDGTKA